GAGVDRLPAGEGADALREGAGVAHGHRHVFERTAHAVGDDLRQRGAGALALRRRAGRDRNLAARQHADGDAFKGSKAGALDIVADADADVAALLARLGLARTKAGVVRKLD